MGTALNYWDHQKDGKYNYFEKKNYDLITAENSCKMVSIAKSDSKMDFSHCKSIVDYAQQNKMQIRAHNLVWVTPGHGSTPGWLNDYPVNKLENFMTSYIENAVKQVGNYPFAWDVVNEAIDDNHHKFIKDSVWGNIPGFICKAFQTAKKASPNQGRFYNDYNILSKTKNGRMNNKSNNVYKLVKKLHDDGCGITGVGFQAHINIGFTDFEGVRANMKRYADLGLDVHITELDVKCEHNKDNKTCKTDWSAENLKKQADVYKHLLQVCLESPNCKSFETWGFTDKYSWLPEPENGLPFDRDFKEKPAFQYMLDLLKSFPRNHESVVKRLANTPKVEEFLQ